MSTARIHRGDSASWTDGERVLGFQAGLGVQPAEVYLPPEREWGVTAPAWAKALRATVERDFAKLGVRVVVIAGAPVLEGHPER